MTFTLSALRYFSILLTLLVVESGWFMLYARCYRDWIEKFDIIKDRNLTFPSCVCGLCIALIIDRLFYFKQLDVLSFSLLFAPAILLIPVQWRYAGRLIKTHIKAITPEIIKKVKSLTAFTIFTCFFVIPGLYIGIYMGLECLIPTIKIVSHDGERYDVRSEEGWPRGQKTTFGGYYIDNISTDTLYRVVVRYAIPGADRRNNYAITDTIAPGGFSRVKGRVDEMFHPIAPMKMWDTDKKGVRHQRVVTYLVNHRQLEAFVHADLSPIGLQNSYRVEAIDESSRPIWMDTVKDKIVERVIEDFMRNQDGCDSMGHQRSR